MGRSNAPRLVETMRVDLPVIEASGLAATTVGGVTHVVVVGDRTARVGVGRVDASTGELGGWRTVDLSEGVEWPLPPDDSQLEAVASDGGSLVAVLREDPPEVLVADTEASRFRARIRLAAPSGSALERHWGDPSSRGEGLVLLRGGRLLVAKEKHPPALVEFAPLGSTAGGVSRADFLADGEAWQSPDGDVQYEAVAMWKLKGSAKKALADISALGTGRDGSLWLLSDKSRRLARLSLDQALSPAGGPIRTVDEVWRLPKGAKKPEGVVQIDHEHVLFALDSPSTTGNGIIARTPGSAATTG